MYAAECSPAPIRGALVMMWQMFTAFGIMLGYVADLAFYRVPDTANITGLSWRLMLGSAGFPALIVMVQGELGTIDERGRHEGTTTEQYKS